MDRHDSRGEILAHTRCCAAATLGTLMGPVHRTMAYVQPVLEQLASMTVPAPRPQGVFPAPGSTEELGASGSWPERAKLTNPVGRFTWWTNLEQHGDVKTTLGAPPTACHPGVFTESMDDCLRPARKYRPGR